jgi:hypothetical protein
VGLAGRPYEDAFVEATGAVLIAPRIAKVGGRLPAK